MDIMFNTTWGSLVSCGRLLIGLRRLPTAAQDNILPYCGTAD
jgi:hypothetical protein